jgi:septal ring factor EnvC (AmiA/AmiB activator)
MQWRRIFLTVLLFVSLIAHAGELFAGEVEEQSARLKQLREHIGSLKDELGDMRGREAGLQRELESLDKAVGRSAAEMRKLEEEKAALQVRLAALEQEQRQQRRDMQKMRGRLVQDLRSAYLTGQQEQVRLLLSQEDPATVSRILAYHGYFTRSRSERIQALRGTLAQLAATGQEIAAQQRQLDELLDKQRDVAAELAGSQSERSRVLVKLQARLRDKSQELKKLQQDEKRLHRLVESLQQALRDIPPVADESRPLHELKGKLRWPVAGRISMRFGARQAGGKLVSRGVRILAPAGAEVRAIARGRVAYADWLRGFGLLLIVDHGNNYMSLYGNNRTLYKEVGEWVKGGEVVATVGSSGGQSSDGLYLEMRKKGRPFDPGPWFAGKPSATRASR